jgi:hypothetical protein
MITNLSEALLKGNIIDKNDVITADNIFYNISQ